MLVRPLSLYIHSPQDEGIVRANVWALRGTDSRPARTRHVAGILDARHGHRFDWMAAVRRDRHHGEHRPRASDRARHAPWSGLLGRGWHWPRRYAATRTAGR